MWVERPLSELSIRKNDSNIFYKLLISTVVIS